MSENLVPWVIRYPKNKYINIERIGSEKYFVPFVYEFLEEHPEWCTKEEVPLNHLNLDDLILDANINYGKPSIYNVYTIIKYLETIDLSKSKPVLLDWKNKIIDGRHRILKALVEGKSTIPCIRIKAGLDLDDNFNQYIFESNLQKNKQNYR